MIVVKKVGVADDPLWRPLKGAVDRSTRSSFVTIKTLWVLLWLKENMLCL